MLPTAYGYGRLRSLLAKPLKMLVMQLTVTCIVFAGLCAHAYAYSQTVSLSVKDMPLQKVFNEIKKQTGYSFAYFESDLVKAKKVSIEVTNANLTAVLQRIFNDQPLAYTIVDKVIVVKAKSEKKIVVNGDYNMPAPPIDIRGRVVNEKGDPIAGATVTVKGTKLATATNGDGEFELKKVDALGTLVVTGVNVETRETPIAGRREVIMTVNGKTGKLDEVQVIAYGTTSQRVGTGNVSSVKADDIGRSPVQNPLLALVGRVSGLTIEQTSGFSGGGVTVRIQGINSLGRNSDPLYVLDGVPYISQLLPSLPTAAFLGTSGNANATNQGDNSNPVGNPLNYINPSDIESIDVLKDADATAIYGSRGANGVILITTKKGKLGQTKVDFNVQQGWGIITRRIEMLNTRDYLEMRKEAYFNSGQVVPDALTAPRSTNYDLTVWDPNREVNWQKELINRSAQYTNAQVSVSGGTAAIQYLVGATYNRQTGVTPGDFADRRGAVHFNITSTSANQRFKSSFSGNYMIDDNRLPGGDITTSAITLPSNAPYLYKPDGSLNWGIIPSGADSISTFPNPLATLLKRYNTKAKNLVANATFSYKLLRGVEFRANMGYNNLITNEFYAVPLVAYNPVVRPLAQRASSIGYGNVAGWIIEPQLTYALHLGGGKLEVLAGSTFQQTTSKREEFNGVGYTSDVALEDIKSATTITVQPTLFARYNYNAFFGRVNYNWQNKYILNVTGRRDGSSRFGSQNLFHTFYGVGGAWIFTNENLVKKLMPILDFGKIRASYGTTGNDQIGDYKFMPLYSSVSVGNNYQGAGGLLPTGIPNPYLQWEETQKWQMGIDLGFFNDRILLNAGYYRNRSSNQLLSYTLPATAGLSFSIRNFPATIQNMGWEMGLNTVNLQSKHIRWTSSINVTINRNKLVSFENIESSPYATSYKVGKPFTFRLAYDFAGVDPLTGLYRVKDINGNLTSNPNALTDKTVFIITTPRYYGGFQNNIRIGSVEIDFLLQFVRQTVGDYFGQRPGLFSASSSGVTGNQPAIVRNRWRKPGDLAINQKVGAAYSGTFSTAYSLLGASNAGITDGSYMRLKNLSVSWQLPAAWKKAIRAQNARLFVQGQNLWTFTKYAGLDPETGAGTMAPLKVITLGAQLSF